MLNDYRVSFLETVESRMSKRKDERERSLAGHRERLRESEFEQLFDDQLAKVGSLVEMNRLFRTWARKRAME